MNRRQGLGVGLFLALGLLLVGVLVTAQDRRHRRFYETGKTVQSFLKTYCQGLAEGAAARPTTTLPAPWSWDAPTEEGGVRVEALEVTWPSGTSERWDAAALPPVTAGVWRCVEGTGTVEAPRNALKADRIAYDERGDH